jgi:DNA-binding CsgD family transcriptional regulator
MTWNDAYASIYVMGMFGILGGGRSLNFSLDDDWVGALSRLGRLVFSLHRLAATATAGDFQRLAFEALKAELPFDSGLWATGVMNPGPILHSVYTHDQPPEMMVAWQKIAQHDSMLLETLKYPGQTLRATPDSPEGGAPFRPEVKEHAHRFGMEHILGTSFIDPALNLVEGFALYRSNPKARFSEPERLLTQHALPHLVEAWRMNRLRLIQLEKPTSARQACGLCDSTGLLRTAGADFAAMMRNEWPHWHGPKVPAQWMAGGAKAFVGRTIAASLEPINDLWLVKVRRRAPLDNLTPREIDVAMRFGQGMNYQEIAVELHIAPATVRNHLTNIYGKLGVGNKVELARLLD